MAYRLVPDYCYEEAVTRTSRPDADEGTEETESTKEEKEAGPQRATKVSSFHIGSDLHCCK